MTRKREKKHKARPNYSTYIDTYKKLEHARNNIQLLYQYNEITLSILTL